MQNEIYDGPSEVADKSGILEVIEKRNIKYLIHFTRCENIEKICSDGLLPVKDTITGIDNEITRNDFKRLDHRLNHISLSVTKPNIKLMHRENFINISFAFIILDPNLLKCHPALFFPKNAAKSEYQNVDFHDEKKNSGTAFEKIFCTNDIQSPEPKCLQAEIQVLGPIPPKWIKAVLYSKCLDQRCFVKNKSRFPKYMHCLDIDNKCSDINKQWFDKIKQLQGIFNKIEFKPVPIKKK